MNKINKALWAKKKITTTGFEWLPLYQHLEDTRQIGGMLWEHWLSDGQKSRITNSMNYYDSYDSKKIFMFICSVHDIGKATPSFSTANTRFSSTDLEDILLEKLEKSGFKGVSELKLANPGKSHHALAGQTILQWAGIKEDIASIIGSHHGKTVTDEYVCIEQKSYLTNYFQLEDKNSSIYKMWEQTQLDILEWALMTNEISSVSELPVIPKSTQIIFSGLLIMADWIASNEDYFPLIDIFANEVMDSEQRIIYAYNKWHKSDLWISDSFKANLFNSDKDNIYSLRFGFNPKRSQEQFTNVIENCNNPGIFIFEAPMGLGKTEAALIAVEQLAHKKSRSGLFFGLPTQATSNGIFPRINSWLENISKNNNEKYDIRLAHGKAALNSSFSSIATNINIDEEVLGNVVINEWFSGRKKTALDDFVVGTVDQFLLMSLKQKHVSLRHLGFDKKVVVIDEVHAYDVYMSQYLLESIKWLGVYGVPVVLLSATLPYKKRHEIISAYLSGVGESRKEIRNQLSDLSIDSYPLITYTDNNKIREFTDFDIQVDKNVSINKINDSILYKLIGELINDSGIVGIIVNTVKKAQDIASDCIKLFGEEVVFVLHSSFISTKRIEKEEELINMIGKNGDRPIKKIIIGTQVIEQSLDIDFDVLITDLAPMDLLIQRIGRLHRHKIVRPKKHETPKAYVLGTSPDMIFEEGSSFVYGDYYLFRTQYYLEDNIKIPMDISKLVQKVYSDDELLLSESMKIKYSDMKSNHLQLIEKKAKKARAFLLRANDRTSDSLIGWLNNSKIIESEEKAYAQVRDSKETIEVIVVKKIGEGYSFFDSSTDISMRINEYEISKEISKNTIKLPNALTTQYNIEKTIDELENYNRKYLHQWQNQTWLKGSLGIIFDENNEFELNGFVLRYDSFYGLTYERKNQNE